MKVVKYVWLICLLHTAFFSMQAQTSIIDSLKNAFHAARSDKEKLETVFLLNEHAVNPDTILPFIEQAERIVAQQGALADKDMVAYCRATYYTRKNITDSALVITEALINRYRGNPLQQQLYLKFLFFKSKILDRANQYSKAIAQLFEVIEVAAVLKDTLTIIQAETGIGWVQVEMEQYRDALKWLYKAKNFSADKKFYKNYSALYSNMASAYNSLGMADSAKYYIDIAIQTARENENLLFLATSLSMQAKIFIDSRQPQLAEASLSEALVIRKKINDPFYIVYDMSSLASYYATNQQPGKGIALCNEGILLAKQFGLPSQLLMMYHALAENYKAAGNMQEYGHTLEYIIALKDSFNNINSSRQLAEMQAKNDAQKNENIIIGQRLDLLKKNYLLYGSLLLLLTGGGLFYLFFKEYKKRQQLKMKVMVEEEKRMGVQAVTDAEESQRKRIAADLHDNLGVQANAILYGTELLQQETVGGKQLVDNLHDTAKDMLVTLRETLWAMKAADVRAADVWLRIISFSTQMQRYYQAITITAEGMNPPDFYLNSARALNAVLIVQEAVNNAARHAMADQVTVNSQILQSHWQIEIKDNGKGFDLTIAQQKKDSYGLANMNERAKAAGVGLQILTQKMEGTRVILLIPLQAGIS